MPIAENEDENEGLSPVAGGKRDEKSPGEWPGRRIKTMLIYRIDARSDLGDIDLDLVAEFGGLADAVDDRLIVDDLT